MTKVVGAFILGMTLGWISNEFSASKQAYAADPCANAYVMTDQLRVLLSQSETGRLQCESKLMKLKKEMQ